jgi:hypothetical protein
MEWVTDNVHLIELFVRNFDAFGVCVCVKFTSDSQSRTGGRGRHELHHHLMADQRLSSPVLTDVGKEPMFNLVPSEIGLRTPGVNPGVKARSRRLQVFVRRF